MRLISHRGNITGPKPGLENTLQYIEEAIEKGYDVEVDVWYKEKKYFLGHDEPLHEVSINFLKNEKIWCHCKNIEALQNLLINDAHCFFHNEDEVTLTSENFMWVYPEKKLVSGAICVLPEKGYAGDLSLCAGICSDYIEEYHEKS